MASVKHSTMAMGLFLCALVVACGGSKKTNSMCTGAACGGATGGGLGGTVGGSSGSGSSTGTGGTSVGVGSGGTSSTGGSSGSSTGGSSGGSTSDAGTAGSSGGGSGSGGSNDGGSSTVQPLPMTGDQLSVCTMAQGECNKGYACHLPTGGAGQGFCSKICTMDSDCAGLAPSGTTYTCPAAGAGGAVRVCQIPCTGTMDTTTCPKDMACMASGFAMGVGGAGGGFTTTYSCSYTANAGMPPGTKQEWDSCMATTECVMGLVCVGGAPAGPMTMARPGHCSKPCMMTADCMNDKPSSGTISPTCVPSGLGGAGNVCALSCATMRMGCPTNMQCVTSFGMTAYCQSM